MQSPRAKHLQLIKKTDTEAEKKTFFSNFEWIFSV